MRRQNDGDQPGYAATAALVAGARSRRIADRLGDHAANWIVGAADPAGADAEIGNLLGVRGRGCEYRYRERRRD